MVNLINTLKLDKEPGEFTFKDLGKGVYLVKKGLQKEVIEVLAVDFDTKTMQIRHQHSIHDIVFKNELDLVLDSMGIKRNVEVVNSDIKAPMPGKVIEIIAKEGDQIQKGDPILILEAMKMENVLKAENDCVIKQVFVKASDNVEKNQVLVELDPKT